MTLVLLAALCAAAATPAGPPAPPPDRAALVGTWKIVSFGDDGGEKIGRLGAGPGKNGRPERAAKLVVTDTACWVLNGNGERVKASGLMNCGFKSFALDPTTAPKGVDLVGFAGPMNEKEKTYPAEFRTTGDMNTFVCERLSDTPEPPPVEK